MKADSSDRADRLPSNGAPLREALDVMDALSDGILIVDDAGRILDVNAAMESLLGAQHADVCDQHISKYFPTFDGDAGIAGYSARSRRQGGIDAEAKVAGSKPIPVHIVISEWSEGGRDQYILAVRDFRGIRFAQERLLRTERLAAIGETMAALAHESRNALQRMQSCLTLMRLRSGPDVQELIDDMQDAQDQLQKLYEEVRQFAAPVQLKPKPTDIASLLEKTWEQLDMQWQPKRLRFRLDRADADAGSALRADGVKLCQVFRNVLENAIDVSPESGTIRARLERGIDPRDSLKIVVEDEGPGIAREEFARIFELLFTTKDSGTGMGLAIARRIVNEHGGEIHAENAAPRGARIVVILPREPFEGQ